MYYLSSHGAPCPAEAPHVATADEKHEWGYGLHQHQKALESIKGLVDQRPPRSIDPPVQEAQARARRFCEDRRRAEIGRENQKLVDRLVRISRGNGGVDPRAPPPLPPPPCPGPPGGGLPRGAPRPPNPAASVTLERSKSLNGTHRRKTQQSIEQDNASLVRRILAVKSTFDPRGDQKDYKKHQRTVHMLQRMPDAARKPQHPRSLPPLRPPRPSSNPALPLRGLEELLLPGDLQKSKSGPCMLGPRSRALSPVSGKQHAATAPLPALEAAPPEAALVQEPPKGGPRPARPLSAQCRYAPPLGPIEGLREDAAAWRQQDNETERRRWLEKDATPRPVGGPEVGIIAEAVAAEANDAMAATGMAGMSTTESDVQYDQDWDEHSMSSLSPAASRVGPRTGDFGRSAGDFGRSASTSPDRPKPGADLRGHRS